MKVENNTKRREFTPVDLEKYLRYLNSVNGGDMLNERKRFEEYKNGSGQLFQIMNRLPNTRGYNFNVEGLEMELDRVIGKGEYKLTGIRLDIKTTNARGDLIELEDYEGFYNFCYIAFKDEEKALNLIAKKSITLYDAYTKAQGKVLLTNFNRFGIPVVVKEEELTEVDTIGEDVDPFNRDEEPKSVEVPEVIEAPEVIEVEEVPEVIEVDEVPEVIEVEEVPEVIEVDEVPEVIEEIEFETIEDITLEKVAEINRAKALHKIAKGKSITRFSKLSPRGITVNQPNILELLPPKMVRHALKLRTLTL